MTDGRVDLNADARFGRLENQFSKLQNKVHALEKQNAKLVSSMKRFETVGSKSTRSVDMGIGRLITRAGIAYFAIQKLNEAWQERKQVFDSSATVTERFAKAEGSLMANLADFSTQQKLQLVQAAKQMSVDPATGGGVPVDALIKAMEQAGSAASGDPKELLPKIIDVVGKSASVLKAKPDEIGVLAAAIVDFSKITQDKIDTDTTTGKLLAFKSQSRLEDIGALKSIGKAMVGWLIEASPDMAPKEMVRQTDKMLSAFAAIGSIAAESEGPMTSTAMNNLVEIMKDYKPKGMMPGDFMERLVDDKALVEKLKGIVIGKAGMKPTVRSFIDEGFARKEYRDILPQIEASDASVFTRTARDVASATKEIKDYNAFQLSQRRAELRMLQMGDAGFVQQRVFGEQGAATIEGGLSDYMARWATDRAYGAAARAGVDPKMAGAYALWFMNNAAKASDTSMYGPGLGTLISAARKLRGEKQDLRSKEFEALQTEIQRDRRLESERRGQTQGAATAHVQAHTE